jgi:predicted transcriptional regulator
MTREHRVSVRLSDDEQATLEALADRLATDHSTAVRLALRRMLEASALAASGWFWTGGRCVKVEVRRE